MSAGFDAMETALVAARRASLNVARSLWVAFIIILAIGVGLILPVWFSDWIAALPAAGLAVGAAALLGVLKGLFDSLPVAWDYIAKGEVGSLPKIFAQVAVGALGLGFAYYAAVPTSEPRPAMSLVLTGLPPPLVMNESDALLTTFVVFGEETGTLDAEDQQITTIGNLVSSLATCIHSPDDRIDLVVRAYASSSGTDADNIKLYKERADFTAAIVANRAKELGKLEQFNIQRREWKSLEAMKLRRLFRDTDGRGEYSESAGALNRRAEIKVLSAGSCMPA